MLESVINRAEYVKSFIYDDNTRALCRMPGTNHFTRDRLLPYYDVLNMTLNKQGLTTTFEIDKYEKNVKGNDSVKYSDEAYFKQRRHLNPEVFKTTNVGYLSLFYNGNKEEIITTKGFIVCGNDGSDFEIPNTKKCREHFGAAKGNKEDKGVARASVSTIYDVNNHFYLDSTISHYPCNEIEQAKIHIKNISYITDVHKILSIYDMGYASLGFIHWLLFEAKTKQENRFLIRVPKRHYTAEKRSMTSDDETIEIMCTKSRMERMAKENPGNYERMKGLKSITVRMIRLDIPIRYKDKKGNLVEGMTEEYLITNLTNEEFAYEEFGALYFSRWGVEKAYDNVKNKLKIESFTGTSPQIIEQDIYSHIFVSNQIMDMVYTANQELKQREKQKEEQRGKPFINEKQVNINKAIGYYKSEYIKIMIEEDPEKRLIAYEKLLESMIRKTTAIRKNRENQERVWNNANKNRSNLKPSF